MYVFFVLRLFGGAEKVGFLIAFLVIISASFFFFFFKKEEIITSNGSSVHTVS